MFIHVLHIVRESWENVWSFRFLYKDCSDVSTLIEEATKLYQAQLSQFTGELVHEISNPLTAITLNLELLKSHSVVQAHRELQERTQVILHSIKHLNSVLVHARGATRTTQDCTVFSLNEEMRHLIDLLKLKAEQHQVTLLFHSHRHQELQGNPVRFSQAIFNLLLNAIDAYQLHRPLLLPAQKLVVVTLAMTSVAHLITIRDWGPGISASQRQHIFQLFYSTKNPTHNQGIGLYLAKKIIETEFHGQITVQSEVSRGTSFLIKIPRKWKRPPRRICTRLSRRSPSAGQPPNIPARLGSDLVL